MIERFIETVGVAAIVLVVPLGYLWIVERAIQRFPRKRQEMLRPWLWIAPALVFLAVLLLYPALNTIVLSFMNGNASKFAGFDNYQYLVTNTDTTVAIRNNVTWLLIFIPVTIVFGLLMAVLTDRVPYERVAKAIMFMPMAISFVAAGVIWKFMYDYRPPGAPQTGTVNALYIGVLQLATQPRAWLIDPHTNNLALIVAAVWMLTGFCMVIFSAGIKGIPQELLEAARVDGANEWQAFIRITFPLLLPTLGVIITTLVIVALKAFDIVYVLTGGNYDTDLLATRMFKELFSSHNYGRASAIAVVILIATLPVLYLILRNFRRQESAR